MLHKRQNVAVQELRNHAMEIARAFNIDLREMEGCKRPQAEFILPGKGATESISKCWVNTLPIASDAAYAIAMHEMGHIAMPGAFNMQTQRRGAVVKIEEELAAWEWAMHYALAWTDEMQRMKDFALRNYEANAVVEQILGPELTDFIETLAKEPPSLRTSETIKDFLKRRK